MNPKDLVSAGGVSAPPWLAAIEAKLRETDLCHECQADVAALVEAVKALRGGLIRAHDAFVTFERKALESPTDSITITGALLKELRRGAAAVLGTQ